REVRAIDQRHAIQQEEFLRHDARLKPIQRKSKQELLIAPTGLLDTPEFGLDIRPLVKRQPTAQAPGFTRRAVRKLRVGVEAWHRRIRPGSMARVPGSDDPAFAVG